MKPVGKPDAGNPHVRFDERGEETDRSRDTAPLLDSTTVEAMSALEGREVLAGADEAAVVGGGMIWTRVMGGLGGG